MNYTQETEMRIASWLNISFGIFYIVIIKYLVELYRKNLTEAEEMFLLV